MEGVWYFSLGNEFFLARIEFWKMQECQYSGGSKTSLIIGCGICQFDAISLHQDKNQIFNEIVLLKVLLVVSPKIKYCTVLIGASVDFLFHMIKPPSSSKFLSSPQQVLIHVCTHSKSGKLLYIQSFSSTTFPSQLHLV